MMLTPSDYIALTALLLGTSGSVLAYLHKVRINDIRHLDKKIDDIQATVTRIEDRLDDHVRDHATGVFK